MRRKTVVDPRGQMAHAESVRTADRRVMTLRPGLCHLPSPAGKGAAAAGYGVSAGKTRPDLGTDRARSSGPRLLALGLVALLVLAGCCRQTREAESGASGLRTYSSFDRPSPDDTVFPAQAIRFEEADLGQVLNRYAEVSRRSVIRAPTVPDVKVTFANQTPMGPVEVLRALDTVLAAHGIAMVYLGSHYVKAVPAKEAPNEPGPVIELPADQLPESSSFLIYIVKLRRVSHQQVGMALAPLAKLPNSIVAIGAGASQGPSAKTGLAPLPALFGTKDQGILILRDYSANVRRMLQVLQKLEQQ